jgi:hypothetical protein
MKSQELLNEEEQIEAIDEWNARRPTKPKAPKPVLKQTDVVFGIGLPIGAFGILIGFSLMMLGLTNRTGMKEVLGLIGIFSFLLLPFVLPVAYVMGVFTLEWIRSVKHQRKMAKTGWNDYEEALASWRGEGNHFYQWIAKDYIYKVLVKASQDD